MRTERHPPGVPQPAVTPDAGCGNRDAITRRLLLLAVLTALPVGMAFFRAGTLVTGITDIMHYIASARAVRHAESFREGLRALLQWAPGWPLVMVMCMRAFGSLVPVYILMPAFTWAVFFLTGLAVWRITRHFQTGLVAALTGVLLLLFGSADSVCSLLYPFREPLSFLGIALGWVLLVPGCRRTGTERTFLLAASGLSTVLAAAVREPAVLALAGSAAYVFLTPDLPVRQRGRAMAALLAPLALAGLALAGLSVMTGQVGSSQFSGWRQMTDGLSGAGWWRMFRQYAVLIYRMLGLAGLALGMIGIAALRRRRAAMALFVLPAVFTLAFYATFAVYSRYALSVMLYIAPVAGIGAATLADLASRSWRRHPSRFRAAAYSVMAALLAVMALTQAIRLHVPGRISPRELQGLIHTLRPLRDRGDRMAIDVRHRHLHELLIAHLDWMPVDADVPANRSGTDGRLLFLDPRSDAGHTQARVRIPAVAMRERILRHHDIMPVPDASGRPVTLVLNDAVYTVREIRPWTKTPVRETFRPDDVHGGLVWFDWRASGGRPGHERRIEWLDAAGQPLETITLPEQSGLQALAMGNRLDGRDAVHAVIHSGTPIPAQVRVSRPDGPDGDFGFGHNRRLSVMSWAAPPAFRSQDKWGVTFETEAAFRLPNPSGSESMPLEITFRHLPRFASTQTVSFVYSDETGRLGTFADRLDGGELRHTLRMAPDRRDGPVLRLRLQAALPESSEPQHFRLLAIGMRLPEGETRPLTLVNTSTCRSLARPMPPADPPTSPRPCCWAPHL